LARRLDADWIRIARRFAFAAWLFLGVGILLGARWSYAELGWGGYWGWDAVENASLMPWLTGTALLHSLMIQEKRGMLKVWNVSLVLATGTLAVMGTFLVRSGILNSIHAFGGATLGVPFVVLIGALIAGSIYLVVSRREMLRSEHRLDSLFSRESIFLANNLVLVALCFVIFWGTYFPLISEALSGHEASVGPPWFDRYTVPLALMLVLLSGIGPVIAWRRTTLVNARRNFAAPVAMAMLTLLVLEAIGVRHKPLAIAMFCCGAFVLGSIGQEFLRGIRVRRAIAGEAAPALWRLHRPRWHGGPVYRRRRVVVLPARRRVEPGARELHARRCLHDPLRAPDGDSDASQRHRTHRLDRKPRRDPRRHQARAPRGHAATERGLLRLRPARARVGRAPDRRPGGQPHQHERRGHA
jgi:cytochrome c-type biogenesis protein CcmF